jgi:hypothetical protein
LPTPPFPVKSMIRMSVWYSALATPLTRQRN